jgi:hypothetical protein
MAERKNLSVWECNADHEYIQMGGVIPEIMGIAMHYDSSRRLTDKDLNVSPAQAVLVNRYRTPSIVFKFGPMIIEK